tara:strand:+ start:428 stop:553 length:126 start_codon:yes stop_codon:yes gene_type:complete
MMVAWERLANSLSVTEHLSGFQGIVLKLAEVLGVEENIKTD